MESGDGAVVLFDVNLVVKCIPLFGSRDFDEERRLEGGVVEHEGFRNPTVQDCGELRFIPLLGELACRGMQEGRDCSVELDLGRGCTLVGGGDKGAEKPLDLLELGGGQGDVVAAFTGKREENVDGVLELRELWHAGD